MLDALHAEPVTSADVPLPEKLLEVRSLTYKAAGRILIDNVGLTLHSGAPTLILGPNGAGKSLLLRLMHGLLTPDSGKILWRGSPGSLETRRCQAMVFQDPVMLRRSAKANIVHALKLRGVAREQRAARTEQALETSGLAHLAGSPARRMSGGEQQRLAIARVLALEPEVIFFDEPTTSLDPASVNAIENLIADTRDKGVKIVLVTHDVGQARRLGGEIVFLNKGRITETGPASAFFRKPESRAAQQFLAGEIVE